jgi:hypothetical protein
MKSPEEIAPPDGYVPWMVPIRCFLRRRSTKWIVIVAIYATFLVAGGLYLRGWIHYYNIDSWPSVDAEIVGTGGDLVSIPTQNRYGGSSSITVDNRYVEFRYFVEGHLYTSKTATPDGGGLPINLMNQPWRAFYKPSSPDVAVLDPVHFQGTGPLVVAAFSGIIVLVHLGFMIPTLFTRSRPVDQFVDGNPH